MVTCALNTRSPGSRPRATMAPSTLPWSCSNLRSSPVNPTQQILGSRNDGKQPVRPILIGNFPVDSAAFCKLFMISGICSIAVSPRNFNVKCIPSSPIHLTRSCSRGRKLRARSANSLFSSRGSSIVMNKRCVLIGIFWSSVSW